MSEQSLPLATLYSRALNRASRASNLPTVNDETQELIRETLSDLAQLAERVVSLSMFSPNETLEDISTIDLAYLSLPFVHAEVQNRIRTIGRDDRMSNLTQILRHLNMYTSSLETYEIVPEAERELYDRQPSSIKDISKRRELKIKQYKTEKDLRTRLEVIRRRRRKLVSEDISSGDFDIVASLLLSSEDDEDDELENVLRETTLLLLRLFYAQARAQLEAVDQEIQLLCSAPSVGPPMSQSPKLLVEQQQSRTKEQEDMWRIDTLSETSNRGPLLDPHGKPLRPFTILPASESNRARLHAQVFGPDHRLPTMTINEYLEIEQQRGGILPAKGDVSETEPTSSEQLTIDSEMDGSMLGDLKAEEKRHKDEQWAQYKDAHPKGMGNSMNRG